MAGKQNGRLAIDHFTLKANAGGRVDVASDHIRNNPRERVISGEREAIDRFEAENPEWAAGISPEDEAGRLVHLGAEALPRNVGPPYSILIITLVGNAWREPGCCLNPCEEDKELPRQLR